MKTLNLNQSDVKAIVFDLGGVLFKEGKAVALERLAREKNYEKEPVLKVLTSPESTKLRRGLMTDDEFWSFAQAQLPEGYDALLIKNYWYDGYVLDEDIFNLVKKLKKDYKLITFSGNVKSRVEYLEKKYGFKKYFDLEIYSFDCGLMKPQEEFLEVLIEKSGLRPEKMVYVDDDAALLKPAEEMGFKTAIYRAGEIADLENKLKSFGVNI